MEKIIYHGSDHIIEKPKFGYGKPYNDYSEYTDIRWNATRILLTMSRNPENYGIVNHQLVNLIDSDSVYIKNLIMRHLHTMNGIADGTKDYIISKCKYDANFVVRMVCAEVEKGANKE